jgi:hypothetical protein
MYEMVTHPVVFVDVVVDGHTRYVANVTQTVGSEGFTVAVLVVHSTTVAVVNARRSTSAASLGLPAADARVACQKIE